MDFWFTYRTRQTHARSQGIALLLENLMPSSIVLFQVTPLQAIEVVESAGAGDAFVGGLRAGPVQFVGDVESATHHGPSGAGLPVTRIARFGVHAYKSRK